MVDPWKKSKKWLSGKSGKPSSNRRAKKYTIYLDEDFVCDEVVTMLQRRGIKYRTYRQDGPSGTIDEALYPEVAKRSCVFITSDWHQRYRKGEQQGLIQYGIRHFVLPGNMSGTNLAELLVKAKNNIFAYCRQHDPPFSVSVHRDGTIHPRMNKEGIIHGRKKPKAKAANAIR